MRSNHLLLLSGVLVLGLVVGGCTKKENAAPSSTIGPAPQAATPATDSAVTQSSAPTASRSAEEWQANSQLGDLRLQVDAYEKIYKRKPASLEQMVREGFMNSLPLAPPGKRFDYDPATASVRLVAE